MTRSASDTGGYVTFCRPAPTDLFVFFQNTSKLDHEPSVHD